MTIEWRTDLENAPGDDAFLVKVQFENGHVYFDIGWREPIAGIVRSYCNPVDTNSPKAVSWKIVGWLPRPECGGDIAYP